jgi:hypothetical protein
MASTISRAAPRSRDTADGIQLTASLRGCGASFGLCSITTSVGRPKLPENRSRRATRCRCEFVEVQDEKHGVSGFQTPGICPVTGTS